MKIVSFPTYCAASVLAIMLYTICLPLVAVADGKEQAQQTQPQAFPVSAITLKPTNIQQTQEIPGRLTAYKVAEIRPQVTGIITKRLFEEGGMVEKGQQLYQIDPAPYQALYNSAKADLLKAEANLESVAAKESRYDELAKLSAVSKQDYDDARAALLEAKASIAVAEAAVATAEINLNYTMVYSPISGQIGKSNVTEGALVTANQTDMLSQVTQLDPIFVDIYEPRKKILELKSKAVNTPEIMVNLDLDDGFGQYEHQGKLQFTAVIVDPTTSNVELRAIFPNPDKILFPGLFVRATLLLDKTDVLLIPQQAAIRGLGGTVNAWVIDDGGNAKTVPIKIGDVSGNNYVVNEGLKEGDTVITAGFQKIRPGSPVVISSKKAAVGGKKQPQAQTIAQND